MAAGKEPEPKKKGEQGKMGTCKRPGKPPPPAFPTYISVLSTLMPQRPVTASKATCEEKGISEHRENTSPCPDPSKGVSAGVLIQDIH